MLEAILVLPNVPFREAVPAALFMEEPEITQIKPLVMVMLFTVTLVLKKAAIPPSATTMKFLPCQMRGGSKGNEELGMRN